MDLEELEKEILEHYERKGFVINQGEWGFKVNVESYYKDKNLTVVFHNGVKTVKYFTCTEKTYKELFKKSITFFKK